jgi:hypothetical protein
MPRWEYLEVQLSEGEWIDSHGRAGELEEFGERWTGYTHAGGLLNELGAEGWELAGVWGTGSSASLYFKRPTE